MTFPVPSTSLPRRRRWRAWLVLAVLLAVAAPAAAVALAGVAAARPSAAAVAPAPPRQAPPRSPSGPPPGQGAGCIPGTAACVVPTAPPTTAPSGQLPLPLVSPPPSAPPGPVPPLPRSAFIPSVPPGTGACPAYDCIPQPPPTVDQPPASIPPPSAPPPAANDQPSGPLGWLENFLFGWLDHLVEGIVFAALSPLLALFGHILQTPPMDHLLVILDLWGTSEKIAIGFYVLLVLVAGVLVMSYQTLQTRVSIKEIAPRVVMGFIAATLSLWLGGKAIELANGLAQAIIGSVDVNQVMQYFTETIADQLISSKQGTSPQGFLFFLFTLLAMVIMVVVVLVSYFIRVAILAVLLIAAPLLLMFHALPQTDAIAAWWWRTFGTVLAIQIVQSLVVALAIKAFYVPGTLFAG